MRLLFLRRLTLVIVKVPKVVSRDKARGVIDTYLYPMVQWRVRKRLATEHKLSRETLRIRFLLGNASVHSTVITWIRLIELAGRRD
jgi:hypothetical protein